MIQADVSTISGQTDYQNPIEPCTHRIEQTHPLIEHAKFQNSTTARISFAKNMGSASHPTRALREMPQVLASKC